MGINGLLPLLENSSRSVNICQFRGSVAAVDSYCWLHKGAFGCSEKLARGEETNGYVLYCLKYLKILQNAGVRPIMVFDGRHLPAKRETEEKRRELRRVARKRAAELLRLDRANEARNYLRQCIDVTHDMALALIKECRKMGVDCIVAPYEADAQMAFLNINKIVDVVITEDSDLILFGCDKILFKLDSFGNGTLVEKEKLYLSMQMSPDTYNFDKFRYMCILSGCDYIQSLPGIGLKKALKFMKLTANPDIYQTLTKLPSYLNMRQLEVTDEYREEFMVALATFKHQIIFNPLKRKLEHLTDPQECGTPRDHCRNAGEFFDEGTAYQLALGNLDPFTLKKVDNWDPDKAPLKFSSIWSKDYKRVVTKTKQTSPSLLKKKVKSTKNIDVTIEVKGLSVIEKDDDFKDELEVYKSVKVEEVKEVDHKVKEQEENLVKSILNERKSFNPFIKKDETLPTVTSKLLDNSKSDSQQLPVHSNSDETSGYLTQDTEESVTLKENHTLTEQENTTLSDSSDFCMENNDNTDKQQENIDTICDIINLQNEEEAATLKQMQTKTSNNKISFSSLKTIRRKMVILENNQATKTETPAAQETHEQEDGGTFERLSLDKRKRSVSTDDEIDDGNDSNVENLTPPCMVENSANVTQVVKRTNFGPCRSVGLNKRNAKKKVLGKNQPTLLAMFAAIKK